MIRRLVAALLVAMLAFALTGCGGGSEEAPAAPAEGEAPPAPVAEVPAEEEPLDRSNVDGETFEAFPIGDFVPEAVAKRLDAKPVQPMLLFFYDDSERETANVKEAVEAAVAENRGAIDLISFDLGQYTSVNDKGEVTVKESKLADDENAKQAVMLARELKVRYAPSIVLVDDQGYVIFKWRGYIDADMLARQVDRTKK